MEDNGTFIPAHIRENLKQYQPNITENNVLCLECGYHGCMGFTVNRSWDFGSYFNILFWGLFTLGFLIATISGGGLLSIVALVLSAYWCRKNIEGHVTKVLHCPNCKAQLIIKQNAG